MTQVRGFSKNRDETAWLVKHGLPDKAVSHSRKKGEFESFIGQKFHRLLVISLGGKLNRNTVWNCQCDCGQMVRVIGSNLKSGKNKSCGCLKRENTPIMSFKHGHATGGVISPEYMSWQHMRNRCNNPNDVGYARYGGRGIKVCGKWNTSFEAFFADVGPKPSKKHSLGRIDNNGNYEPGNVAWETPIQQGGNNSRNRNFTIGGRTMCLSAWIRERGLVVNTVHRRLKRGQTIEVALELEAAP